LIAEGDDVVTNLFKLLGIVLFLAIPSTASAQAILESTSAARLNALIRAKLCEKTCRYGDLRAERYTDDRLKMLNGYKFYLIKSRGETCNSQGCPEGFLAINNSKVINLVEGYRLNPKHVRIPAEVAIFAHLAPKAEPKTQTKTAGALCRSPGRQLNTALIKQIFAGKTLNGISAKGSKWSETLQANGRTRLVGTSGKVTVGRYQVMRNQVCFKYRANQDFSCKIVFECTSNEGEFILATQDKKITSVITHVSSGRAEAPAQPEAVNPIKPLVPDADGELAQGLAECRAVRSDLRRLNCYDALAKPKPRARFRFRRAERTRLTELMNFRNLSGVTQTKSALDECTLTMFVDAPEVRLSFANEAVINMAHLDLERSQGFVRNQDALYSFVAMNRRDWPLRTIDKSRNTERSSRSAEALLAVTADLADLPEVEGLIKRWAEQCQRG
jgi:hypothetical protein